MKNVLITTTIIFCLSCSNRVNHMGTIKDIFNTEKEFEAMAGEKGIAEAFYHFADENAVILRDTIIRGKDNIKNFYSKDSYQKAEVNWTPDFIEISDDGTLGYTYGKYKWKIQTDSGTIQEFSGIFHTVWKKQIDGNWRYVWD